MGDVVLTLPMAGIIKEKYPDSYIFFLGKNYTKPVIELSKYVDKFISWDVLKRKDKNEKIKFFKDLNTDIILHVFPDKEIANIAKKAGIKTRIGTSRRIYHLLTCNKKVKLKRKNSSLHEAQLNIQLLKPLDIDVNINLNQIPHYYGFVNKYKLPESFSNLIDKNKFNLILHPKSKGSAREWGVDNYIKLIDLLPHDKYKIFITGSTDEKQSVQDIFYYHKNRVTDLMGVLSLQEFISFINACDGLIAASTGPLHIAAAFGKKTIGLYAPMKPIFPTRWAPLGENAHYLVIDKSCNKCPKKNVVCECIQSITPENVYKKLLEINQVI
ncbi:MAG: glycosyltransferase family 9 protein [Marinilabiliales bacterium]